MSRTLVRKHPKLQGLNLYTGVEMYENHLRTYFNVEEIRHNKDGSLNQSKDKQVPGKAFEELDAHARRQEGKQVYTTDKLASLKKSNPDDPLFKENPDLRDLAMENHGCASNRFQDWWQTGCVLGLHGVLRFRVATRCASVPERAACARTPVTSPRRGRNANEEPAGVGPGSTHAIWAGRRTGGCGFARRLGRAGTAVPAAPRADACPGGCQRSLGRRQRA